MSVRTQHPPLISTWARSGSHVPARFWFGPGVGIVPGSAIASIAGASVVKLWRGTCGTGMGMGPAAGAGLGEGTSQYTSPGVTINTRSATAGMGSTSFIGPKLMETASGRM